jgi:protein-S-isoprenylcysteine O-methyltransferase Ste14
MPIPFRMLTVVAWCIFLGYWLWSARRLKRPTRAEPALPRLFKYWLPILLAILLMWPSAWLQGTVLGRRFMPYAEGIELSGLLLVYAGILFACWARYILGSNWSSEVQLKQDHELIARGPYRYVRHPIYTGVLLALFGTTAMLGECCGLLGFAIMFLSFWRKLRLEETWLGEHFGTAYADYMRRVKALIPGVL